MTNVDEIIFEIASRVFGGHAADYTLESNQEQIKKWDSLRHVMFIDEVEKTFSIKFTIDEIFDIETLGDAAQIVKKHLG